MSNFDEIKFFQFKLTRLCDFEKILDFLNMYTYSLSYQIAMVFWEFFPKKRACTFKKSQAGLNRIIIVTKNAIWKNFGYVRQNFVLITFLLNNNFVAQTVFEITDIWFM